MDGDDKSEYEVGYGKPPVATRFVKGQSGNPKGRPRRSYGDGQTDIERAMSMPYQSIMINGKKRMVPGDEYFYRRWIVTAARGDVKAAALLHSEEMHLMREKIRHWCGSSVPPPSGPRRVLHTINIDPDVVELLARAQQEKLLEDTRIEWIERSHLESKK